MIDELQNLVSVSNVDGNSLVNRQQIPLKTALPQPSHYLGKNGWGRPLVGERPLVHESIAKLKKSQSHCQFPGLGLGDLQLVIWKHMVLRIDRSDVGMRNKHRADIMCHSCCDGSIQLELEKSR